MSRHGVKPAVYKLLSRALTFAFVGVILVNLAAAQPRAGQERSPGGRGFSAGPPRFGEMMYLERTWAAVAFVCNASRDQLAKLRPTYQEAYTSRRKAFEKAREAHDFEAIQKASENARKTIDAKLKQVLSSDQIAKLKKWQDNQEAVARKLFAQGANAPRGTLRDVMYIERSWAALTFEVKVSDDQLQKLRSAAYAAAWAKREKALQSGDVTALGKTTASIKTDVDAKIKQVLTAAQWQQFQQWQTRRGRLGRGGGGPGPGAGRGRGMGR